VKTALKGKRFYDAEDVKKNVMAKLNAVLLEAFAIFKNFLYDSTCIQLGRDYYAYK
jgi:hypothetical protein